MKKRKQLLNTHDFIDGSKVIIIWDMIQEKESEGILVNEDDCWFVCQNDVAGDAPEDTHGYSYGWNIGNFWNDANNISSVKHIYLAEEEKQDESKIQLEHIEFVDESFVDKINRLIDTVNEFEKDREEIAEWIAIVSDLRKQVRELQTKVNKFAPNINFTQPEVKENVQDDHYWFKQQKRYKAALVLIRDLTGGGMSYHDIVIEMREIAKWALDPNHQPLLIGRYDKETSELLDILGETKGDDNE